MADPIQEIRDEASRIEEDSLYSAKGHWEAAKPWEHRHLWMGIPTTICAAAAGVSAFADHAALSGVLAVGVAIGTALMTFINPSERHRRHAEAGNSYKTLNNDVRIFKTVECAIDGDAAALLEKLNELNQRRNNLNQASPLIPRPAFERARKGIEDGEATHRVDNSRRGG